MKKWHSKRTTVNQGPFVQAPAQSLIIDFVARSFTSAASLTKPNTTGIEHQNRYKQSKIIKVSTFYGLPAI
eukprot:c5099_g1_i1 orf=293-505(-)